MTRSIYTVINAEGIEWTIIAESPEEAEQIAREAYCSDDSDGYEVEEDHWDFTRRWVGFESESDAERQIMDLRNAGVDPDCIHHRHTTDALDRPLLWEVSATDDDWCRLPSGVLCGGGE